MNKKKINIVAKNKMKNCKYLQNTITCIVQNLTEDTI